MNWYSLAQKLSNPYAAIEEIKSMGFPNPLNNRETVIGQVKVDVCPYDNNTIWLKSIASMIPKQGYGTTVLRSIIDVANKNGVAIYLDPMSFGDISNRKLISWYTSNGFVRGEGDFNYGLIHVFPAN